MIIVGNGSIEELCLNNEGYNSSLMNSFEEGMSNWPTIMTSSGVAKFLNNKATQGGAMYLHNSAAHFDGGVTVFSDNEAEVGGGIYFLNSENHELQVMQLDAQYSYFVDNKARKSGAALYVSGNYSIIFGGMTNSYFTNNSVGAINITHGSIILRGNSYFAQNTKEAALAIGTGIVTVSGRVLFYDNEGSLGGGIRLSGKSYAFLNGISIEFRGNSAVQGGGIYSNQSVILSSNGCMTFIGNTAQDYGGGIAVYGANLYSIYIPTSSSQFLLSGTLSTMQQKYVGEQSMCNNGIVE